MKTVPKTPCDACNYVGTVTEIELKSGDAVRLCYACLHQSECLHNVIEEKKDDTDR